MDRAVHRLQVSAQLSDNRGVREGIPTTTTGVARLTALAQPLVNRGIYMLVRDEEVVGSNPATPTEKHQVNGLPADHCG